jgi:uncharacterized protein DUF4105
LIALAAILVIVWATAALYFDIPAATLRIPLAAAYAILATASVVCSFRLRQWIVVWILTTSAVMVWWFSLRPSNYRDWQPDVAQQPWSEVQGSHVTIHNVRNAVYRTETDYTPRWETRTVDLDQLTGVDLFLTHWGSPYIAHAIVSFAFRDGQYMAMSIEVRKTVGQSYSAIRGFFRQYELIYLAADERDIVRLRTNYRVDEYVRLYHTKTKPEDARRLFLQYLTWMEEIRRQPQWYNALTDNCTSSVTSFLAESQVGGLSRWDWRNVFNGKGDEMLYQLGDLETGGLPFDALAKQAVINETAKQIGDAPDFSQRIRQGRVGF